MTFSASEMVLMAHGNNKKIYHYTSSGDALATIVADDYFLTFSDQLDAGDVIFIEDSASVVTARRVSASSSSTVTVAALDDQKIYLAVTIADISTADQVYIAAPVAGLVSKVYSVIDAAISVADATLTTKINGSAITGGAITVAYASSAAGDVDSVTPTAANSVSAGDALEVETDGGSTDASKVTVVFEITPN